MSIGFSAYFKPVAATAEEEAYTYLLHHIRMGKYRPGERLIPEEIAADIGTSRMPVREAFRRLASEGLLNIRPNRGAIVRGLTSDDMKEVFDMRAVLEGLAGRVALPSIGEMELAELERLIDVMVRTGNDLQPWVTAHRNFHEYLCQLSGWPRLIAQISALHSVVEPHMRLWFKYAETPMTSKDVHMPIIDAIRSGDPAAVEATIREHVEATVDELRQLMSAEPKS